MDLNEFQNLTNGEFIKTSFFVPKKLLERLKEFRINYREVFTLGARLKLTEVDRISEIAKSNEEYKQQVELYSKEIKTLRQQVNILIDRENQRIDKKEV